jgi:heat shock protein HslJ
MSEEHFPYRVRTGAKRSIDADFTLFEGCGRYVVDYRLNDTWVLTRLGERILKTEDFSKGLPIIEFHLADSRVAGNSGCNGLSGSFQAKGNKVAFGQLATTRMACSNMAFEHKFLSMITNRTLRYTINGDHLVLTDDKDITLAFDKTD